jgi:hypothetical protein
LSASTSHAFDSELDFIVIKPVIVVIACLNIFENSFLNNCMKPKSEDTGTQAHSKFILTCHNCGKVGHIRPNCFLLKTHRTWVKQDASRKGKVEESFSSKYLPPHRRHIKGKDSIICKNANLKTRETVKKHSNKRSMPACHHCGITGHILPKCPQLQAQKSKVQKELPTRVTSGTLPPTALQAPPHQQRQLKFVPANQSGQHGMLRSMANMDITCKPSPQVKQVCVKNDETIHPLRGSGLTYQR